MNELLTRQKLVDQLRNLGIAAGTSIVVHSALRSLGPVEGGGDTVLNALLESIGKEGLLVMPTFTYNNNEFSPETSPSRTGALTEIMRNRPGSVRSLHPTHSVAALGKGAIELCKDHYLRSGMDIDSPLDRLARAGGKIVLLGVGHVNNSTIHVGEARARMPYLDIPVDSGRLDRVMVHGTLGKEIELRDPPGCSRAFGSVELLLRKRGAIRDGLIGRALVQYMSGEDAVAATIEILQGDPAALLCTDPLCFRCTQSRVRLRTL